jgi:hypothetical protein
MKKQEDYRIKIEEWKEITDIGVVSKKHINFCVQKRYGKMTWIDRNILGQKDEWYTQSCHDTENEALIAMRNLYNRENPTTNYINY